MVTGCGLREFCRVQEGPPSTNICDDRDVVLTDEVIAAACFAVVPGEAICAKVPAWRCPRLVTTKLQAAGPDKRIDWKM